jgi:hypothetical protein
VNIIALIIQLIAGAIGGNVAGYHGWLRALREGTAKALSTNRTTERSPYEQTTVLCDNGNRGACLEIRRIVL